jgi:hypothetical protein
VQKSDTVLHLQLSLCICIMKADLLNKEVVFNDRSGNTFIDG